MSSVHPSSDEAHKPVLIPVSKPLSLIPVTIKEAALDSPTFRATAVHISDQVEQIEKWLDGLVKAASKLSLEIGVLEGLVNAFIAAAKPPQTLSEATIDHDYTLLALRRFGDGAQDFWSHAIGGIKNTQHSIIDPIKAFLHNEVRPFKEARRQLDTAQKSYETILARYASQTRNKEASSLREDAFQLHESRRFYLKASMDLCVIGPQMRLALDVLLIRVFSDQWLEMKQLRESTSTMSGKGNQEMERVRFWSLEMLQGERTLKRQLLFARKQIEDAAEVAARPLRDLDAYTASSGSPAGQAPLPNTVSPDAPIASKQGWLFLRTITGKPARTSWVRRWFFVQNGIFGSLVQGLRSGGVEESEKIGVLLCNSRLALQEERRFCFEVKTKDATILLQAETQAELTDWLAAFDAAKQKAFEDPNTADSMSGVGSAFSVSPAVAPELAAKQVDGSNTRLVDESQSGMLGVEQEIPFRASFDVTTAKRLDSEREGERSRDHAARIIQKLDLHRKAVPTSQTSGSSAGGIASLISSSHSAFSVPGQSIAQPVIEYKPFASESPPSSSLAPSTLAAPPAATNLSKTALMIGSDRGLDLGTIDTSGGVPSSLMANQWGSTNYGHLSRIQRGEVSKMAERRPSAQSVSPSRRNSEPVTPFENAAAIELAHDSTTLAALPHAATGLSPGHHKVGSAADDSAARKRAMSTFSDFPSYYPGQLKAHDAQFRMLFPNVGQDERVVLVFRASWNPDENQDLPGRVFVTPREMYFYSQHLGLVLVSGVSLEKIVDVSVEHRSRHDLLYVNIKVSGERPENNTVTLKTFLEPLQVLQKRLNYLVSNFGAEEPDSLEEILRTLVRIEAEHKEHSPTSESWEDLALTRDPQHRKSDLKTSLRVDGTLFGGDSTLSFDAAEVNKFRLPNQPVSYTPHNVRSMAVERTFDVSTKALFHIMFGDRSAICQILYRERHAQNVKQTPWVKGDLQNPFQRQFEYQLGGNTISDTQTIDVMNEHLCYVVTDAKTPWHLPHSEDFQLISKYVITHIAKSKSRLAVYVNVDWIRNPILSKHIIERYALDDLYRDGRDIVDLVDDQVQRLGPNCHTKKAIHIFGHVGHQTEASQITSTQHETVPRRQLHLSMTKKTLPGLMLETMASVGSSAASTIFMSLIGLTKALFKALSAHSILLTLLLLSSCFHLFYSSNFAAEWWHDRKAATFMHRVGVKPEIHMSKAIYLHDIRNMTLSPTNDFSRTTSKCADTFRTLLAQSDSAVTPITMSQTITETSTRSTIRRLQRTRQRLGTYRHDILVALRLINSVEQDTIHAEFETWLYDENLKCHKMSALMQASKEARMNESVVEEAEKDRSETRQPVAIDEGVLEWYRVYCDSCRVEQDEIEGTLR